jgi:hypothetical protein
LSIPHQMTRTRTLAKDVEEWSCTVCSRRLLMRRPPEFQRIILEHGDERAAHVGGTGGLQPATMTARPAEPSGLQPSDRTWLAEHGIDSGANDTPG